MTFDLLYAIEVARYYARRLFSLRGVSRAVRPECDYEPGNVDPETWRARH